MADVPDPPLEEPPPHPPLPLLKEDEDVVVARLLLRWVVCAADVSLACAAAIAAACGERGEHGEPGERRPRRRATQRARMPRGPESPRRIVRSVAGAGGARRAASLRSRSSRSRAARGKSTSAEFSHCAQKLRLVVEARLPPPTVWCWPPICSPRAAATAAGKAVATSPAVMRGSAKRQSGQALRAAKQRLAHSLSGGPPTAVG